MRKNCANCSTEIEARRWSVCPECGAKNHFKLNKKGRIKKHICHVNGGIVFKSKK